MELFTKYFLMLTISGIALYFLGKYVFQKKQKSHTEKEVEAAQKLNKTDIPTRSDEKKKDYTNSKRPTKDQLVWLEVVKTRVDAIPPVIIETHGYTIKSLGKEYFLQYQSIEQTVPEEHRKQIALKGVEGLKSIKGFIKNDGNKELNFHYEASLIGAELYAEKFIEDKNVIKNERKTYNEVIEIIKAQEPLVYEYINALNFKLKKGEISSEIELKNILDKEFTEDLFENKGSIKNMSEISKAIGLLTMCNYLIIQMITMSDILNNAEKYPFEGMKEIEELYSLYTTIKNHLNEAAEKLNKLDTNAI
jgi:hypothetical protein